VLLVSAAISGQMLDRTSFANSELHRDVMDRWGAPIVQPSPSVRYVPSGAVFNTLSPLPLASQEVVVDAAVGLLEQGQAAEVVADVQILGDQQPVDVFGSQMALRAVFEQVEDFQPGGGGLQAHVFQIAGFAHGSLLRREVSRL